MEVGERFTRADPRKWPPVVARELAAQLVHEAGLVGVERRPREPQDQTGGVLGPILGEREQKLRDHGARVVVEPAEEAEVEQGEPPVLGQETLPRCGSAW